MTPLPPVRKRTTYSDIQAGDLTFALFHDRILNTDAMSSHAERDDHTATKTEEPMDYADIADTLQTAADALATLGDDAIKAGRRNSSADQAVIQQIYDHACDLCDLAEALGADAGMDDDDAETVEGSEVETTEAKTITWDDEIATYAGGSVKAIAGGDGWATGYLVTFGGDGDLTSYRDRFQPDTDYSRATKSDVYVHHRMLPGLGKKRLTNQAEIGVDDVGVFIKHLLNLRDPYEKALYGLAQQGKLGWSSGTAPHLVEREKQPDGSHVVKAWPLGLDASYTPTPAGGLAMNASAMKSLFADAGIDLLTAIYSPEATEPLEPETKTSDRAQRILDEVNAFLSE